MFWIEALVGSAGETEVLGVLSILYKLVMEVQSKTKELMAKKEGRARNNTSAKRVQLEIEVLDNDNSNS